MNLWLDFILILVALVGLTAMNTWARKKGQWIRSFDWALTLIFVIIVALYIAIDLMSPHV